MKVLYLSRRNLVSLFLIFTGLFFIVLNTLLSRGQIADATSIYKTDIPIYSVGIEEKKCAITFDCAWGAEDIPRILDILDGCKAKATFFIVGLWAEKYPDSVKLIHDRGHEVANHGYAHLHLSSLPEDKVAEEITRCSQTLERITGGSVKLFRAPYGEYTTLTVQTARKLGYPSIQWDCDSLDWKDAMSTQAIYDRVVKKVTSGSIVLFHNDTRHTEEVLPDILKTLSEAGYSFVTVSDMLLNEPYRIRYDGRQVKE